MPAAITELPLRGSIGAQIEKPTRGVREYLAALDRAEELDADHKVSIVIRPTLQKPNHIPTHRAPLADD